MRKQTQETK